VKNGSGVGEGSTIFGDGGGISGGAEHWGGDSQGSGHSGDSWSSDGDGSGYSSDGGGSDGDGSGYSSDGGSGNGNWSGDFSYEGFPVDDGVESVEGVGGVFDGTAGAVRIDERVAALDDISAAAFNLALGVSGQTVLDVVSERVLWVGVVLVSDYGFGDGDGGSDGGTGNGSGDGERSSNAGNGSGDGKRSGNAGNGSSDGKRSSNTGNWGNGSGNGTGYGSAVGEGGWGSEQPSVSVSQDGAEDDDLKGNIKFTIRKLVIDLILSNLTLNAIVVAV
jgi:hypothetical protein